MSERPAAPDASAQDLEHLRVLALCHYVVAGLTALFSLFPVIHLVMGLAILNGWIEQDDPEARMVGWVFVGFAALFITCGLALSAAIAYAGRCLQRRRKRTLCLVVAVLSCLMMPFGTLLGVFTLVLLTRPSVKALFAAP